MTMSDELAFGASAADLERTVTCMRALGVSEWNGIKLGPPPLPPAKPAEPKTLAQAEDEKIAARRAYKRTLLASTGLALSDEMLDAMETP
jgi:hypothetical protein